MACFVPNGNDDSMPADLSAATATAAIARTRDLKTWERLPTLKHEANNATLFFTLSS